MDDEKKTARWTIVGILISGAIVVLALKYFSNLEGILKSAGVFGPLLSIGFYGLFSVTPIPTDSLTIINGMVFGTLGGTIIATVGNTAAALVEYFLGLKVRDATGTKGKTFTIPIIKKKFPVNSTAFLIFGRFLPGYGGKIVSVIGGMYKISIWKYTWTALVANFIGALMFAYGGHLLRSLIY
ncbi:hypothetical protein A2380_02750 [candidate division WWE3 bacterium RIFOXYB1_FULL_43_24]|uniref:TVP38/TMEM64 family membrane protein n=2 Tax=Katanobacteria TaxID=422282 RepID=A0A0G1BK43_UNCKA|nr:MAG: hypothetical protein UU92_C0007G0064 [candidate division WWE3 bacterium GW2011_GWA1_42_12]KKS34741.1 MAG: hypothetical protein UU97_C0007G0031 [candidate division WWE3 bacterium GW2011_GWD1_42_14]KKS37848.1 MAG: hypothetical protein UV00_C0011G0031 [candidate division WWE3 bacterium GW2011_GWF1_42_14]KKS40214.1 MAG: hypothetical protein UV03_C0010G0031 [candidate division WWE3 bacterium GW2011_GWE1_42_16]KKS66176.1 MAG: hypothetical protein UV35_C0023G0004 [candidate division WWE3 bacte